MEKERQRSGQMKKKLNSFVTAVLYSFYIMHAIRIQIFLGVRTERARLHLGHSNRNVIER